MTAELLMKIENLPPLCASLPYKFAGTGVAGGTIDNIVCNCASCHKPILASNINGEFTSFNNFSVSLTAYGICREPNCLTITPIESKFSSDGSALHKGPQGWSAGTWGSKPKAGWPSRIKAFFIGENNHE